MVRYNFHLYCLLILNLNQSNLELKLWIAQLPPCYRLYTLLVFWPYLSIYKSSWANLRLVGKIFQFSTTLVLYTFPILPLTVNIVLNLHEYAPDNLVLLAFPILLVQLKSSQFYSPNSSSLITLLTQLFSCWTTTLLAQLYYSRATLLRLSLLFQPSLFFLTKYALSSQIELWLLQNLVLVG